MSNLGDLKRGLTALAQGTGGLATIHQLSDILVTFTKPAADSMATDTTSATVVPWTNAFDFPLKVVGARLFSASALTAHDTNYATITVLTDDGANGTPAVVATWATTTTGTGNWVADTDEVGTLTVANAVIPVGGKLHYAIAKASSGVAVPITHFVLRLQRAE